MSWVFCDSMDCSQAPLSMGFSRQEYWSGLPFPSPGDLPNSGIEPASPAFAGEFFTAEPSPKPQCDGSRKRSLWEVIVPWGRNLTNGISALQGAEETRVLPFFQVRTEVRTRKESLIRHQISWCLDLGLPNHQNCGKSMYVINHLIYGIFVIVSWLNWDTYLKQTLFLNMDLNVAIMLHTWAILSY